MPISMLPRYAGGLQSEKDVNSLLHLVISYMFCCVWLLAICYAAFAHHLEFNAVLPYIRLLLHSLALTHCFGVQCS